MTKTFLTAALLATTLLAQLPKPAEAGGSFGVTISAQNGEEAEAISTFLRFYAASQAAAEVIQNGDGNLAGIAQSGEGHHAVVSQHGDDHSADVRQRGRGHSVGVFQFGRGTRADVSQSGENGAALVFMGGW